MKVSEAYSIIALVFSNNFRASLDQEKLSKLNANWLIKTENEENKKGSLLLEKALQDINAEALADDLNAFKGACDLKFFKKINEAKVEDFYKSINFKKPFGELKACHISNMLALLSVIFKNDTNDKSHALLGLYLSEYLIPSMVLFAKFIRYNAKTSYYKAMGEFMIDYAKVIKSSLGLRIEIE